jgi:hypothetical protein
LADKKVKRPTYTTPVGIARYPHLNKADTRFNADGDYKCDVRLVADDAATTALIERLETLRDEKLAEFEANEKKAKDKIEVASVFTTEFDDEGNETGYVIIKTKLNATGKDKKGEVFTNEPKLFDAESNVMPKSVQIWSGSKVIVAGTVNTYAFVKKMDKKSGAREIEVGVSLKCRGVQVIELVSGGGQTAESFGFKKQAGYKAPAAAAGIGSNDDGDADAPATESTDDGDTEF